MGFVVQGIWEPEVPLKAMAGMPRFAASVVAPTVPEMRVVVPRFAIVGGWMLMIAVFNEGDGRGGKKRTADVEACDGEFGCCAEEFGREGLDAVAH